MHSSSNDTNGTSNIPRRTFLGLCASLPAVLSCVTSDQPDQPDQAIQGFRSACLVNVLEQAAGQDLDEDHHCSVSLELADGLELGDQVRIQRTPSEYALYTVVEFRDELDPTTVRLNDDGLDRLGTNAGSFEANLDTIITRSELSDAEAKSQSEFVERLIDDGVHAGLVVTAVHGGKIEAYTDQQAERVAANLPGVSSWICKGWRSPSGAFDRWHVPSTELSPNSFPGLGVIADRGFGYALSFHGMSNSGILIGGRAPIELRELLRGAIIAAIDDPSMHVTVSGGDGPLIGIDTDNFVNWLTAGGQHGIQIEQSAKARKLYWAEIADAVSSVLGPLVV
jgi:phage replication-related protein YjqB (UPF0714/DUF867 family)